MALDIKVSDKITMKKKHPCGGSEFTITRVGADCRAVCDCCGGIIEMPRRRFESSIKKIDKIC